MVVKLNLKEKFDVHEPMKLLAKPAYTRTLPVPHSSSSYNMNFLNIALVNDNLQDVLNSSLLSSFLIGKEMMKDNGIVFDKKTKNTARIC